MFVLNNVSDGSYSIQPCCFYSSRTSKWKNWEIIQPGPPVHQWGYHEDDRQQAPSRKEVHQGKPMLVQQFEQWKRNLVVSAQVFKFWGFVCEFEWNPNCLEPFFALVWASIKMCDSLHFSKYVHSRGNSPQLFSWTPRPSLSILPHLYSDTLFFCQMFLQETLGKLSPVAYVDILEGDAEGYVRFHTPEEARVVSDAQAELQKEHSWKLEILSGEAFLHCWLFLKVVDD